ncbi:hypothetical protein CFP56_036658 [Quercus suber]|uniref:Uncharacterized protein n=1 Tax=Quercus suber TaxID=58331 RepID=A0AAW0MA95_QUESU
MFFLLLERTDSNVGNIHSIWKVLKKPLVVTDVSSTFSPLVISVAEASKTLRLLTFESGSFTLPEKSSHHYMHAVHKIISCKIRWKDCYLLWLNWSCLRDLVIVV